MIKRNTRLFSLEDDFMNLTIDDLVFGYIQHMATYASELKKLYIPKNKVVKAKGDIAAMIGVKTTRTVTNKINKILEQGLLEEEEFQGQ